MEGRPERKKATGGVGSCHGGDTGRASIAPIDVSEVDWTELDSEQRNWALDRPRSPRAGPLADVPRKSGHITARTRLSQSPKRPRQPARLGTSVHAPLFFLGTANLSSPVPITHEPNERQPWAAISRLRLAAMLLVPLTGSNGALNGPVHPAHHSWCRPASCEILLYADEEQRSWRSCNALQLLHLHQQVGYIYPLLRQLYAACAVSPPEWFGQSFGPS